MDGESFLEKNAGPDGGYNRRIRRNCRNCFFLTLFAAAFVFDYKRSEERRVHDTSNSTRTLRSRETIETVGLALSPFCRRIFYIRRIGRAAKNPF